MQRIPRPVLQKSGGLGHGPEHASTAGVRGAAHGHLKPPPQARIAGSFGQRQPVRQRAAHGVAAAPWPGVQHEPQGQLLGQRCYGEILPELEGGACLAARLCKPSEAQADIADYIVGFHNHIRLHSTLGYQPPNNYEAQHAVAAH